MKKGGAPIALAAFPKRKQRRSKEYWNNKNGGPDPHPFNDAAAGLTNPQSTLVDWRNVIQAVSLFCELASQINMRSFVPVVLLLATAAQALPHPKFRVLAHINNLCINMSGYTVGVTSRPCLI